MKNLLLIAVFCFGQSLFGQSQLKIIEVYVQPELGYRILSTRSSSLKKARDQKDVPGLGYRFGFNISKLSRDSRRAFRTGLNYSNAGYAQNKGDNTAKREAWNAIELPIALRFYAGERSCASIVDVGIGTHYRLVPSTGYAHRILVSVNLGFGFVWAFNEKWGIQGQLPIRYALTPNYIDSKLKENMISAGFELGLRRYLD